MIKFAFFVDGSNLLGSFKSLDIHINDYSAFYRYLFQQSVERWKVSLLNDGGFQARMTKVHWYEVGSMDEWDLDNFKAAKSVKDSFESNQIIKRSFLALANQNDPSLSDGQRDDEAWRLFFEEVKSWYGYRVRALDGFKRFHHGVQSQSDFIEIIECGHWKLDVVNRSYEEKGLDTTLAVDMVTQINNYDVAVLVSGDADAIPSVNYVKREGRHVAVVAFNKGRANADKANQSSSRLRVASDFVVNILGQDLLREGIAKPAGRQ